MFFGVCGDHRYWNIAFSPISGINFMPTRRSSADALTEVIRLSLVCMCWWYTSFIKFTAVLRLGYLRVFEVIYSLDPVCVLSWILLLFTAVPDRPLASGRASDTYAGLWRGLTWWLLSYGWLVCVMCTPDCIRPDRCWWFMADVIREI